MIISNEIKELIYGGASTGSLFKAAVRGGMVPLFHDGLRKVAAGHTTLAEVQRIAG